VRGRDLHQDAEVRLGRRDLAIESGRKRLRSALALTLGTEALIAMKDSAGLDDDEEIVATLEWAAGALLRTALQDFEGQQ
jgi:hypothetical protein